MPLSDLPDSFRDFEIHLAAGRRLDLRQHVVSVLPGGRLALDLVRLLAGGELADLVSTKLLALRHVWICLCVKFLLHLL